MYLAFMVFMFPPLDVAKSFGKKYLLKLEPFDTSELSF